MSLTVVTPAAHLPLAWAQDVKPHLRVDSNDLQALAESVWIPAAAAWLEGYCNRALIYRDMLMTLDRLPGAMPYGNDGSTGFVGGGQDLGGYAQNFNPVDWVRSPHGMAVEIPLAPLKSGTVVVTYVDGNGATQTWNSAYYVVDCPAGDTAMPGRIWPAQGQTWPAYRYQRAAVTIAWTSGYGATSANIPGLLKAALLLHVEWQSDGHKEDALLDAAKRCARMFRVPKLLRENQEVA